MNTPEFKNLLIRSLDKETDPEEVALTIREAGVRFEFKAGFSDRVMDRIFSAGSAVVRETEFIRNLTFVFYRIALPGIAAIVLLLISIFLMEGSLSFNSFLGLGDSSDETIICLLTGK
jgi:hypothetical protein